VYTIDEALAETVKWYKAYQQDADMNEVCSHLLENYVEQARTLGLQWTCS
jgi:hypothetical protein